MILKQVIGRGARGLLNYISQSSKTNHNHTRPFYSNMAGQTPRELSAEFASLRKLKPNLSRAVGHLILAADPLDRALTDAEFSQAVKLALAEIGANEAAFAAYRHHDGHQHIHVFFRELQPQGP